MLALKHNYTKLGAGGVDIEIMECWSNVAFY